MHRTIDFSPLSSKDIYQKVYLSCFKINIWCIHFMALVTQFSFLKNDHDRQHDCDLGETCQPSWGISGRENQWAGRREKEDGEPTLQDATTVSIKTNTDGHIFFQKYFLYKYSLFLLLGLLLTIWRKENL